MCSVISRKTSACARRYALGRSAGAPASAARVTPHPSQLNWKRLSLLPRTCGETPRAPANNRPHVSAARRTHAYALGASLTNGLTQSFGGGAAADLSLPPPGGKNKATPSGACDAGRGRGAGTHAQAPKVLPDALGRHRPALASRRGLLCLPRSVGRRLRRSAYSRRCTRPIGPAVRAVDRRMEGIASARVRHARSCTPRVPWAGARLIRAGAHA